LSAADTLRCPICANAADYRVARPHITSKTLAKARNYLYVYGAYTIAMRYSFDPTKNATNLRKL